MNYSAIPLHMLDSARNYVRQNYPGYKLRTFYLGKRRKSFVGVARQTLKNDAVAAKIALYQNGMLIRYI